MLLLGDTLSSARRHLVSAGATLGSGRLQLLRLRLRPAEGGQAAAKTAGRRAQGEGHAAEAADSDARQQQQQQRRQLQIVRKIHKLDTRIGNGKMKDVLYRSLY